MTTHNATPRGGGAGKTLAAVIAVGLGLVVVAPIALSSGHIYSWAHSPAGLHLSVPFAVLAFVALDLAATVCVCMTIYSGLRGEGAGVFGILTWVFACGSAWVNWKTGAAHTLAGPFFASMSIAGPTLLEATLAKVRKWTRQAAGTQVAAHPKFGSRWLVAFPETFAAWTTAKRENIARPEDALAHVRERRALRDMSDVDAIRYAWMALQTHDEYTARLWLQARGRAVTQAAMDTAIGDRPRTPLTAPQGRPALTAGPTPDDDPDRFPVPEVDPLAADRAALSALTSKRDQLRHAFATLGTYEVPEALAWLSARGIEVSRGDAYAVRRAEQEGTRATLRAIPQQQHRA